MIKIKKNQTGSILYFAILILGILFSAGVTVTTVLIQRVGMIEEMSYSTAAFYAADAGIEKTLYRWSDINKSDNVFTWEEEPEFQDLASGQSYFLRKDTTRTDEGGNDLLIIISTGSFSPSGGAGEIRRGIQVSRTID